MSDACSFPVAFVTGASQGIGASIAIELAKHGYSVALCARDRQNLRQVQADIADLVDVKTLVLPCDVACRSAMHDCIAKTEEVLGPIRVLVNNAGTMMYGLMKNLNQDEWDCMIDVNIKGVLNGIAAALPGMIARNQGHIINISSDAGRLPCPGLAVYSATKAFIESITVSLRKEVCKYQIKVTSIQPGDVSTDLGGFSTDQEACSLYGDLSDMCLLEPEDVSKAVLYVLQQPSYAAVNEILIQPRDMYLEAKKSIQTALPTT